MKEATIRQLKQGMELQLAAKFEAAGEIYSGVLATEPDNPDALHLMGLVLGELDQHEEGVALIERAIAINPNAAPFHHNIAGVYRRMGRLDDAINEFRRAIELKPDYGEAYQGLSEMVKFGPDDPLLKQVLGQLAKPNLSPDIVSYLHFAAGKIYDDIGAYPEAFRHFEAGNRAENKSFSSEDFRAQVKEALYAYSPRHVESFRDQGHPSEKPVFIVGMPRSGTSLVEQVLASHSAVFGAGELNDMKFVAHAASAVGAIKAPYPSCAPGLGVENYRKLGQMYLNGVENDKNRDATRIVDKHPLNFQFLGLILDMFPAAKVIHTTRHPLDTCLSCFFQNFTKGQHYSFNLNTLAHFYVDYRRLMEHWTQLYPGRILEVNYESMLANQTQETKRLLEFVQLPFEEQCLQFHKTDRVVKTASFMQVRQPLYQTSRGRWQNYREQLAPLAAIIGLRLEAPVTLLGGNTLKA